MVLQVLYMELQVGLNLWM